jgi:hypothetical protein
MLRTVFGTRVLLVCHLVMNSVYFRLMYIMKNAYLDTRIRGDNPGSRRVLFAPSGETVRIGAKFFDR